MVRLQLDPFLNELTSMFEHTTEKGSVWVTLKHSSDKSKVQRNKMATAGKEIEFKCLVRATDGKKKISTSVGTKEHQRFQAYYATILKARMTSLKRERKRTRKRLQMEIRSHKSQRNLLILSTPNLLLHVFFCATYQNDSVFSGSFTSEFFVGPVSYQLQNDILSYVLCLFIASIER